MNIPHSILSRALNACWTARVSRAAHALALPKAAPCLAAAIIFLLPTLCGCSKDDIRVYQTPKFAPQHAAASSSQSGDRGPDAAREHLRWELPDGWSEQSASGARAANFAIQGPDNQHAEIAIMPFSRMGGNDLDFINLWRSTLGLDPVDASQLGPMVEAIQIGADQGKLYDVMRDSANAESPDSRAHMVVAQVVRGETSWFFKLAGDAALVKNQTPAFKSFLKSLTFHAPDAHDDDPQPAAAQSSSAASAPPSRSAESSDAPPGTVPQWVVPDHWNKMPPSTMLLAKFTVSSDTPKGRGEITVSVFPGDVGGLLANVNRWRGQIGLAPVDDKDLPGLITPLEVDGAQGMLVDLTGPQPDGGSAQRLIGAILPRGPQTWFYKFLGDASVVEKEKEPFVKFIQSARHPNPNA